MRCGYSYFVHTQMIKSGGETTRSLESSGRTYFL
nr:MAG TPA: hypothetical protein [Caudoviricetes sp.]